MRSKPSGAMAVVRAHLTEIERLKADGATWVAIAAALAQQGVKQRNGTPITDRRLTGLIASVRRQDADRERAKARRMSRVDLVVATPAARSQPLSKGSLSVPSTSVDVPQTEPTAATTGHRSAEQIRRDQLTELYDMLEGKRS